MTINPPNHQDTIKVRIRLDSWRKVKFSTHSVMFYDSDTKQVRNSYEYSREQAGFCSVVTILCRIHYDYNNVFENTEISKRIDHKWDKNTPNAAQIGRGLTEIRYNSRWFVRFSLTIVIKKAHPCVGGISSKMNIPHKAAAELILQLECWKQLLI